MLSLLLENSPGWNVVFVAIFSPDVAYRLLTCVTCVNVEEPPDR